MFVNHGESFILAMVVHALGVTFVCLMEPYTLNLNWLNIVEGNV